MNYFWGHFSNQVVFLSENKAIGVMKPGHSFTIEPMISEGLFVLVYSGNL